MTIAMILGIGQPIWEKAVLPLLDRRKKFKEFRAIGELQLSDAEMLLDSVIQDMQAREQDEHIKVWLVQLALARRGVDRVGDMLRGEDDDAPQT